MGHRRPRGAEDFPLSFARADKELCFDRIRPELRMPDANSHFPTADPASYTPSYDSGPLPGDARRAGRSEALGLQRSAAPRGRVPRPPPSPAEYRSLATRVVDLHPMTIIQNARTSGGGVVSNVPTQAISVGPVETWKAEKVSIWHAGNHDNPFGHAADDLDDLEAHCRTAACRCRCWPIIRTCSSISFAAASAPATPRCTDRPELPKRSGER